MLRAEILEERGDLAAARDHYLKALDYAAGTDMAAEIQQALADLTR